MMGAVICDPQHPQAGSRSDPANVHPSGSSVALWEGRLQVHTGTDKDDPHYIRYAGEEPHCLSGLLQANSVRFSCNATGFMILLSLALMESTTPLHIQFQQHLCTLLTLITM